jgi:hypothetical protein
LLSDLRNYMFYILGPYGNLNELPIPRPITKAETETEYIIEIIIIKEKILSAEEILIFLRGNKRYSNKEYRFDKFASINISIIRDKTISKTEFFADIISY